MKTRLLLVGVGLGLGLFAGGLVLADLVADSGECEPTSEFAVGEDSDPIGSIQGGVWLSSGAAMSICVGSIADITAGGGSDCDIRAVASKCPNGCPANQICLVEVTNNNPDGTSDDFIWNVTGFVDTVAEWESEVPDDYKFNQRIWVYPSPQIITANQTISVYCRKNGVSDVSVEPRVTGASYRSQFCTITVTPATLRVRTAMRSIADPGIAAEATTTTMKLLEDTDGLQYPLWVNNYTRKDFDHPKCAEYRITDVRYEPSLPLDLIYGYDFVPWLSGSYGSDDVTLVRAMYDMWGERIGGWAATVGIGIAVAYDANWEGQPDLWFLMGHEWGHIAGNGHMTDEQFVENFMWYDVVEGLEGQSLMEQSW
jgi:hypothetical protein